MPSPKIVDRAPLVHVGERSLAFGESVREAIARLRRPGTSNLILGGGEPPGPVEGAAPETWSVAPLVALEPTARVLAAVPADASQAFATLAGEVASRRRRGGSARTGIAAVVSFEAGRAALVGAVPSRDLPRGLDPSPAVAVWYVDRSVHWTAPREAVLTVTGAGPAELEAQAAAVLERVERPLEPPPPARISGAPATSLPREAYLRAVERLLDHIRRGDIYQANLCQRFCVPVAGDAFAWHGEQLLRSPAPRAAWAELPGAALGSASPEIFLRHDPDGSIETWPIKGTRPRAEDAAVDARIGRELLASEKDRAELLMIVDLERNDLGRLCRVGSVAVPELAALRTYANVHHLVARVTGRLAGPVDAATLLRATFPGGSISGAPKRRALELLGNIEPVARGWFSGSLFWFGDDGSVDSSILIRSTVFAAGHAFIGAGGGIVADSDPESEWRESNLKARAAARLLGFDPAELV